MYEVIRVYIICIIYQKNANITQGIAWKAIVDNIRKFNLFEFWLLEKQGIILCQVYTFSGIKLQIESKIAKLNFKKKCLPQFQIEKMSILK